MSSAVRAAFTVADPGERRALIVAARDHFDAVWPATGSPTVADPPPAPETAAGRDLMAQFGPWPAPWSAGSWAVWDLLGHWGDAGDPVAAREATRVLFADAAGDGAVMTPVVELLPGPPRLVTPDWWRLGLAAFSADARGSFLAAVQRSVRRTLPATESLRARWHLTAADRAAWRSEKTGRSAEAAAAVATLAALAQRAERPAPPDDPPDPVLDPGMAVTAALDESWAGDARLTPLEPVEFLPAKLRAARRLGIDTVVVAPRQPFDGPDAAACHPVATVGEAFEEMRTGRLFDAYRRGIVDGFPFCEEDTPAEGAP